MRRRKSPCPHGHRCRPLPKRPPGRRSRRPRTPGTPATRSGSRAPTHRTPSGATGTSSSPAGPRSSQFLRRQVGPGARLRAAEGPVVLPRATGSPSGSSTNPTTPLGQWYRSYGNELWEFDKRRIHAAPGSQHQRRADSRSRPAHLRAAAGGRARPDLPAALVASRGRAGRARRVSPAARRPSARSAGPACSQRRSPSAG